MNGEAEKSMMKSVPEGIKSVCVHVYVRSMLNFPQAVDLCSGLIGKDLPGIMGQKCYLVYIFFLLLK